MYSNANLVNNIQNILSHFPIFALEKQPKMYIFRVFSPLIASLVATFNESRAHTSIKYVAEQWIVKLIYSETFENFW